MNLGEIKDVNGLSLPPFDFAKREIPPQITSVTMAENLDTAGTAATAATTTAMGANGILNLLMSASMN